MEVKEVDTAEETEEDITEEVATMAEATTEEATTEETEEATLNINSSLTNTKEASSNNSIDELTS